MRQFRRLLSCCPVAPALVVVAGVVILSQATVRGQDQIWRFEGDEPNGWFGRAAAGAGDVNADGYDDIVVGVRNVGNFAGRVCVFSGRNGSELVRLQGPSQGVEFGTAVGSAADVNGDGFEDIIIGAYKDDSNGDDSGSAWIYSGKDWSLLQWFKGVGATDAFGYSVGGIGDVDLDGVPDVVVGAVSGDYALVLSGKGGGVIHALVAAPGYDSVCFGISAAGAGDVDADGIPDVIVGDNWASNGFASAGSSWVFSGSDGSVLYGLHGPQSSGNYGYSVDGLGDLDGDGHGEFIVGAPNTDIRYPDTGTIWVYSGVDGSEMFQQTGYNYWDWPFLGFSVSGAGDVNLDGTPDFLAGSPGEDFTGLHAGAVWLYSGRTGAPLYVWHGAGGGSGLGYAADAVGDVNGDGLLDIIASAPYEDSSSHADAGSAYVYSGNDLFLSSVPPQPAVLQWLDLQTSSGPPGNLVLLFVVDVNGTPTVFQLGRGRFDPGERFSVAGGVPPGLAGTVVTLRSFALGWSGQVVDSSVETVTFR